MSDRVALGQPLAGIKVLDLSRVLAGPFCTMTLGDMGAEIWKIENPDGGDDTRGWGPPEIDGMATYFLGVNRNKYSLCLDIKNPQQLDIVHKLVEKADIVVENFRTGALEKFGLDAATLTARYPSLIYCSISGYGRTGPRALEAGYDFVIQAESGMMAITGQPQGEPTKLGVAFIDVMAGMNATQAILAALYQRTQTGMGKVIDIALYDTALAGLANVATAHLNTGQAAKRYGNQHPSIVPYQTFATQQGVLALAIGNDTQFRQLCHQVIDRSDWADDKRFVRNRDRVAHRDILIPMLEAVFLHRPRDEWLMMLRANGLPCGPVRTVSEALAAPEATERAMIMSIEAMRLVGSPLGRLSSENNMPPPRLGADTEEVLKRVLGL
jgi:crotonobetainyl-CoA:carnitine CoA-transferase CaiB-like acyl-CoA transferase